MFLVQVPVIFPQSLQVLHVSLSSHWYGKNVLVIQSVVYWFGCEEKGEGGEGQGGGGGFLAPKIKGGF